MLNYCTKNLKMKKHLILTISFLLYCLCSYGQYFEYSKIIGDTTYQQSASTSIQLDDSSFIAIGAYDYTEKDPLKPGKTISKIGNNLVRLDKKGDTIWSVHIKIPKYFYPYLSAPSSLGVQRYYLNINPKNGNLCAYRTVMDNSSASVDSLGYIQQFKFGCDKNGKNPYYHYQRYKLPNSDSCKSGFAVKFDPDNGYFYIYGSNRDSTFKLWKMDTLGHFRHRIDYYSYYQVGGAALTINKNRLIYSTSTNGVYGDTTNKYLGVRTLVFDTALTPLADNHLTGKKIFKNYPPIVLEPLQLTDSSIVLCLNGGNAYITWPVIVKFNKNLDTIWHKEVTTPRITSKIDKNFDQNEIYKLMENRDTTFSLWWGQSYNDFLDSIHHFRANKTFTTLDFNGKIVREINLDSVARFKTEIKGRYYYRNVSNVNDVIPTLDNGYILPCTMYNTEYMSGVVKLSNKKVFYTFKDDYKFINDKLIIYPNPAVEAINIWSNNPTIAIINFINLQGQIVQQNSYKNNTLLNIDVSKLNRGIYIFQIINNNGQTQQHKIILE